MFTRKEIKALSTDNIITEIFYKGIATCNDRTTKATEKELKAFCDELEKRGIVESGETLYESMCK